MRSSARQRVSRCGVTVIDGNGVTIQTRNGVAHYHGLLRCGSVWECPVCAGQIMAERAAELTKAVRQWRAEGDVSLLTLTFSHGRGDDLTEILAGLRKAFTRMRSGRQWTLFCERIGIAHSMRAIEVTHGVNGFHPHIHILVCHRRLTASELEEARSWLSERWQRYAAEYLGDEHAPSAERGCDFRPCHNGAYISKMGLELVLSETKVGKHGNRGMWDVAQSFADTGDLSDLAIWRTYADTMYGQRQLVWSKGSKAAFGIGEKSDEEIVHGEDAAEELVIAMDAATWRRVVAVPGMDAALLNAAEEGGREGVERLLRSLPPPRRHKPEHRMRRYL